MRGIATLLLTLAVLAATAASAFAAPPERCVTGREYAQHVQEHAHMHHFSGEMNPGMHQGYAGFCEHHAE